MKRKTDQLTRLIIFNILFLVLSIVITINLLETKGTASVSQAAPSVTQTVP